jgi:hypothetical protein
MWNLLVLNLVVNGWNVCDANVAVRRAFQVSPVCMQELQTAADI